MHYTHPEFPKTWQLTDPAIEYWWDSCVGNEGWYARIIARNGEIKDDSMKAWFRTRVDAFREDQREMLALALQLDYPDLDVVGLSDA